MERRALGSELDGNPAERRAILKLAQYSPPTDYNVVC